MPPEQPVDAAAPEPRLNVLHVTTFMHTLSSGVIASVTGLARAQREHGMRTLIHCSDIRPARALDYFRVADPQLRFAVSPVVGPRAIGFSPAAERWAASPAAAEFDVLHQHEIWPAFSRMTVKWRAAHKRPTVIALHGTLEKHALTYSRWKKRLALLAWERENLRGASCLHATAEEEVRSFREFGLTNPIALIPVGIPESWITAPGDARRFREAHGIAPERRLLLYLSRIHPKKGLSLLLDALAAMRDRLDDWMLVIAGPVEDAAYFDEAMRAATAAGLGDRVRFVGEVVGDAKRDVFAAAELFVLPTLSDNFALVVAEALGAARPVVTTRAALPWKVLETERCGWWVPPDRDRLAGALLAAMQLPSASRREMGRRGADFVRRHYLWSGLAERTIRLYRWLRGETARPDFVIVD